MDTGRDVDAVTMLGRAGAFQARLDARVERFRAAPDDPGFSVALVAVRGFRAINRDYGRAVGDAVLRELGRRLGRADGVSHVSRVGGDEFAVLGEAVSPLQMDGWKDQFDGLCFDPPFVVGEAAVPVAVRVTTAWMPPDRDDDLLWFLQRAIERNRRTLVEQENEMLRTELSGLQAAVLPGIEAQTQLERYRFLAEHDSPTGLLNRRGVESRLEGRGDPASVAFIDVDDLRALNQLSGNWDSGDLAILGIAQRLHDEFGGESVARWAGDEFLVLGWEDDGPALARRLRSVLDDCRRTHLVQKRPVTFSAGVVTRRSDYVSARRSAQRAAKRSKRKKNRVVLAD